ncbi:DUF541 domain-containing protein [Alginatibacterium sediminis]|uniref:DUF541 domain-containing protein n=1 Tax=Alginatibacterium sediminis TaxID=2164068 RepID=A0A420E6F5_9ALTE|nr:SIMPL domain-containing protein [Alginatibacterium sediminis]RKF12819.1 DUF541 domain-containing protein [Alginatibacterium sediminis]
MRLIVLLLCSLSSLAMAQSQTTLHTQGHAQQSFAADQAIMKCEFIQSAKQAKQAREQVDTQLDKVIERLQPIIKDSGSLRASQIGINAQYDYDDRKRSFTGYQVQRSLVVEIEDMELIVAVIDSVLEHSDAQISLINYNLNDPEQYRNALRISAIKDAKAKAELMAQEVGLNLGQPIIISDVALVSASAPNERYAMAADVAPQVAFQGESIILQESVNITYQLVSE